VDPFPQHKLHLGNYGYAGSLPTLIARVAGPDHVWKESRLLPVKALPGPQAGVRNNCERQGNCSRVVT
jgi:hypothetical protein